MQNFANTSSFPWASASPLHPQLPFLPTPPAHTPVLTGSWYCLPLPAARSLARCISWNRSCTETAWGQRLPAPKPQAPQLHSSNQQTAQGQAAFSTETVGRKQQRFSLHSSGYRAAWRSRGEAITCCGPASVNETSDVSVIRSTGLTKARGWEGGEKARMELTNSHCVPYQHLFFPCTLRGKQGRQGPRGGSLAGVRGADLQG